MTTFDTFDRTPYDDLERQHDAADLPFEDSTPPTPFAFQSAQPDRATLRAQAAASVNYTPADIQAYMETDALAQAEIDERGGYAYAERSLEDKRELLAVGALVKYDCEGCFRFTGTVEALDFERDKALVSWQQAGFGTRRTWCGFDRLTLVLCKAPAALESAVR